MLTSTAVQQLQSFVVEPEEPVGDEELLAQIQHGTVSESKAAFSALYRRYLKDVWCFARSKAHSAEAADEITAAAWSVVVEKIRSYQWTGQPIKSWLMTICWNKIREYWRDTLKEDESLDAIGEVDVIVDYLANRLDLEINSQDESGEADPKLEREADRLLHLAIEQLSDTQKQIILLLYFGKCETLAEVAKQLEMKASTVRGFHKRALERIRQFLYKKGLGG